MNHLLDKLQKVRDLGGGKFQACCPAHDDRSPSLAIKQLPDGKILIKCWAGCTAPEIVEAVGLRMRDLNPNLSRDDIEQYRQRHSQAEIDRARLILSMAASDRKRGKRLSQSDLEAETRAFRLIKSLE